MERDLSDLMARCGVEYKNAVLAGTCDEGFARSEEHIGRFVAGWEGADDSAKLKIDNADRVGHLVYNPYFIGCASADTDRLEAYGNLCNQQGDFVVWAGSENREPALGRIDGKHVETIRSVFDRVAVPGFEMRKSGGKTGCAKPDPHEQLAEERRCVRTCAAWGGDCHEGGLAADERVDLMPIADDHNAAK